MHSVEIRAREGHYVAVVARPSLDEVGEFPCLSVALERLADEENVDIAIFISVFAGVGTE